LMQNLRSKGHQSRQFIYRFASERVKSCLIVKNFTSSFFEIFTAGAIPGLIA